MQLKGKEKATLTAQLQSALGIKADGLYGKQTKASLRNFATIYQKMKNENLLDRINLDELSPKPFVVTAKAIKVIASVNCDVRGLFYKTPNSPKVTYQQFADEINKWLDYYKMTHPLIVFHFLAQICHESDRFCAVEEYRNRDGSIPARWNNYRGGAAAHGRGLIEITHDENYRKYFNHIGKALPKSVLVTELEHIVRSAMFYWVHGSAWGNINKRALDDDFLYITIAINGGFNGVDDRKKILLRLQKYVPEFYKLDTDTHYCLNNSELQFTKNGKKIFKRLNRDCI